jgi:exodeoxyribonuclease-5
MRKVSTEINISDLNSGQTEAFKQICDFISNKHSDEMFVLMGFAGTGKTFLVNRVIQHVRLRYPTYKIALTAPTNKAVKVLRRAGQIKEDGRVSYQTIHKLLGLTEEITKEGLQIFTRKDHARNSIKDYKVLVVDETSMLDDDLFEEIALYSSSVKIIFMGDPAQIPPVNRADCIPFRDDDDVRDFNFKKYTLTEIMRQGIENPIIHLGARIRTHLTDNDAASELRATTIVGDTGIIYLNTSYRDQRDKAAELLREKFCSQEFTNDADYAKVIAWRNQTVNKMNSIIRGMIYPDGFQRIMIGEKLVANKPILDEISGAAIFNTNDEFVVRGFDIKEMLCATDADAVHLKYYDTEVEYELLDGSTDRICIPILHESGEAAFKKAADHLKAEAIRTKGKDRSWVKYYNFLRQFADVGYNYAITAHKSQGSTYRYAFVIEDDIDFNRRPTEMNGVTSQYFERNRIKYTAFTRPSKMLYILKKQ